MEEDTLYDMSVAEIEDLTSHLLRHCEEPGPIQRDDLQANLLAAFGELAKFNDILLQDDQYDELRGMGKLAELMIDSLIARFDHYFPNPYE